MKKLFDRKVLDELKVYLHLYDKKEDQTEQEYLQVVALMAARADDQLWKLLSKDAQEWVNAANTILKANQQQRSTGLKPIPGFTSTSSNDGATYNTYPHLNRTMANALKRKRQHREAVTDKKVKNQANSYYITKFTKAVKTRVVEIVCENPGFTYQEVISMLQNEQFVFSAEVVRTQFDCVKLVIRTLQALDKLSEEF